MTAIPNPSPNPPTDHPAPDTGESMAASVLRRTRYAVAILLSALIFIYAVHPFAAPPAQYTGISFLGWPTGNALLAAAVLLIALLATTVLSTLITHPDTPHTGMFCALLGMVAMAYRGDSVYLLLRLAEQPNSIHLVYQHLALECLVWAAILIAAELVNRWLYIRFFHNTAWLARSGSLDPNRNFLWAHLVPGGLLIAGPMSTARESKHKVHPILANAAAFLISSVVATLILPIFLQSQLPGQAVFAAFIGFTISSMLANWAFPDSSTWPLLLAIPATAAFGYLYAPTHLRWTGHTFVPQHYFSALARTFPIDYIAAGVPGAIFGYYAMLHSRLQNMLEEERNK